MGWMLSEKVRMYPADKLTYEVYANVGRVITVNDVLIEHEHIIESDESKSRLMRIFREDTVKPISLVDDIVRLRETVKNDIPKNRPNKLNRILNIITEGK